MNTTDQTIDLIRQWFHDKGIIAASNPLKQLEKTQEELTETRDACVKLNVTKDDSEKILFRDEIVDGIGDTVVTLIGVCEMLDMRIQDCIDSAYCVISKRTGKIIDGKFVKGGDA